MSVNSAGAIVMRSRAPAGPAGWTPMLSALAVAAVVIRTSFFALESLGRGWPTLAGSAIVLAIGAGHLVRFLKLYPRPTLAAASANP